MNDDAYYKLAKVLNTLPNGFPPTQSGVEIKLLKKIFTPDQADLFCDMRLTFETAEQVSQRTGRELEGLEEMLVGMSKQGQLFGINLGEAWFFKMLPWIFGIFEFQLGRIDQEFAELNEEYGQVYAKEFFSKTPQLMQTLPIETEIPVTHVALPYERVSTIIESGQSFMVNECICKKEQALLGNPCSKTTQVCLAIAPVTGVFENTPVGRVISKDEAYKILKESEEEGLVHLTSNIQFGQIYICNCCGCCCGVLRSINELGIPASQAINSHYYARIDSEKCICCGLCEQERCQIKAIEENQDIYRVIHDRCIGCGVCITACPSGAITLVHKENAVSPPITEDEWFENRGASRGVDFSRYK